MNYNEISRFIWGTADLLRNTYKQHEYGGIILPFTVMRRLDVVLKPTKQAVLKANESTLPAAIKKTQLMKAAGSVGFYNTSHYTMESLLDEADDIKDNLISYVTSFSADMADVFEKFKIFDVIKTLADNDLLYLIVERFCKPEVDLSPESVDNAVMGDIYEELIRKFSEVSNETAGEHFSPRDGLALAAELLIAGAKEDLTKPNGIVKVCDPCAGTGGALSVFKEKVRGLNDELGQDVTVVTYAQEINDESYAICKSDTVLKGGNAANVHKGDTLADDLMAGETFGYQISNPPYGVKWEKSKKAVMKEHEEKGFAGRFGAGLPRINDGQLLFVQHMVAKMRPRSEGGGRIAVFMNGSPMFTGAAGSGESEIRKYLLESDLVEAIIAMPNDFFFNTGISTYIWVLSNNKVPQRQGKVQLINANGIYMKMPRSLGSKRVKLSDSQIQDIMNLYTQFDSADESVSKVFANEDFGYIQVDVMRPLVDPFTGRIVVDKKGRPKADKSLKDTECIPLRESPEDYLNREVRPFAPGAWIEARKDKATKQMVLGTIGYEIQFSRYFFKFEEIRPSSEILADLHKIELEISSLFDEIGGK
ncbi:type I restriction-modification system subunit M [Paraeggerthella hongkongensis]|uniref:site-specific DNA-methyltransferase (adenine-specific) n=1 Tax=Paraeggerthella hongkongensis TaxID=230658 RepID=A0A3N0BC59_9ACTN|nr:class I SAM-dependent DNA methyltransferase [Paraeggerthella hongkongensis]RNL45042.1 restriction endonuclease subunit M [Paraeggerthella hongkongensis]